jgi:sugar phosphate isomerase/epimerase
MKICVITDEISADFETAVELCSEWGVHNFELRGYFTDRVPNFSAYQKQRVKDVLDEYGASVVAIGPGLFKIPYPSGRPPRSSLGWMDITQYDRWADGQKLLQYHYDELLPASLDYASELGVNLVVIFSFARAHEPSATPPEEVLNCLWKAAEKAEAQDIRLAIETEAGYWADTGAHAAQLLRLINNPALCVNWDPGNAFFAGDNPFPTGYQEVREFIRHIHYKDARLNRLNEPEYVADGQIDWAGQIKQLVVDGYDGFISIETHLRPKVISGRNALRRLQDFIDAAQV